MIRLSIAPLTYPDAKSRQVLTCGNPITADNNGAGWCSASAAIIEQFTGWKRTQRLCSYVASDVAPLAVFRRGGQIVGVWSELFAGEGDGWS